MTKYRPTSRKAKLSGCCSRLLSQEAFAEAAGFSYKYYQAVEAGRKRRQCKESAAAKSRFGHRVGIDGNNRNVLITQLRPRPTPDTQEPGSGYAFTIGPTGWEQRLRFAPTASEPASSFGIICDANDRLYGGV